MFLLPVFAFAFIFQTRSCHVTRLVSELLSCLGFQQCWGLQVCSTTPGLEWLALVLILAKFLCDECGILDDNSVKMRVTSWGSVGVNRGLLWATFKWVSCFRWVDIGLDSLQGSVLQLHYLCEIWVFLSASLLPSLYFFFKVGRMWKRPFSVGTLSEGLITKDVCTHSGVVISAQQFAHSRCHTNCFCALSHLQLSAIFWRRRNHLFMSPLHREDWSFEGITYPEPHS